VRAIKASVDLSVFKIGTTAKASREKAQPLQELGKWGESSQQAHAEGGIGHHTSHGQGSPIIIIRQA